MARALFPLILILVFLLLFKKQLPNLAAISLFALLMMPIYFIIICLAGNALARIESFTVEQKLSIPSFYFGGRRWFGLLTLVTSFRYSKKAMADAQLLLDKF